MTTSKGQMLSVRSGRMVGPEVLNRDDPFKPPRRVKCKRCGGTGQRIIHCLTVIRCQDCDGRGRVLASDSLRPNTTVTNDGATKTL